MERAEFVEFLRRAAAEGWLSVAEAGALLADFDNGDLPIELLPLAFALSFPVVDAPAAAAALGRVRLARTVMAMSPVQRPAFTIRILDSFDERAFALARELFRNGRPVAEWHEEMRNLMRDEVLTQAQLGLGRPLTPRELQDLTWLIDGQAERLHRFAEEVSAKALAERFDRMPMSEAAVFQRSRMYAGEGTTLFYRYNEEEAAARLGEGYVARYVARDDGGTCSPCTLAAQRGPYRLGEGPMPGAHTCRGRGKCRCRREVVRDDRAYARLTRAKSG